MDLEMTRLDWFYVIWWFRYFLKVNKKIPKNSFSPTLEFFDFFVFFDRVENNVRRNHQSEVSEAISAQKKVSTITNDYRGYWNKEYVVFPIKTTPSNCPVAPCSGRIYAMLFQDLPKSKPCLIRLYLGKVEFFLPIMFELQWKIKLEFLNVAITAKK